MTNQQKEEFVNLFNLAAYEAHSTAVRKGWWNQKRNPLELIALIHSELSEAVEAVRNGIQHDDKLPQYTGLEAELADAIIRIMDMASQMDLRLAQAILDKMDYNTGRPERHGGKAY